MRIAELCASSSAGANLTPFEACRIWTADAARLAFREDHVGTLSIGKRADLVVLSANPLTCRAEDLPHIQVEDTYVNGRRFAPRKMGWIRSTYEKIRGQVRQLAGKR